MTHPRWFEHLATRRFWDEVNFWRPSAHHSFNGPPGSPFFFKLKAPHNAIGGFGLVIGSIWNRLVRWLQQLAQCQEAGGEFGLREDFLRQRATAERRAGTSRTDRFSGLLLLSAF